MNHEEDQPAVVDPEYAPDTEPVIETESTLNVEDTVEPVIVPTPAPIAEVSDATVAKPEANTPGVIILQWLSYAFWGWLVVAVIWLLSVVLINAILGDSISSTVPYVIAAGVVLLPIAFITDLFYRKHEPVKKTGVAMVIMVIHAVLFALLAIAALIVTVFNSINALIETSTSIDGQVVIIFTAAGATLLYAAAFIRTLNPFKSKKPAFIYSMTMVAATVLLLVLAVVGPLVQALATKDDRRIEQNLPAVSQSINDYISNNEKLPTDLSQIELKDDQANLLVKDGLVDYKAEKGVASMYSQNTIEYRYQLCVTFKAKDTTGYTRTTPAGEYSSYLSVSGHDKGQVCYKLSQTITQSDTSPEGVKLKSFVLN